MTNSRSRSYKLKRAQATAAPLSRDTSTPLRRPGRSAFHGTVAIEHVTREAAAPGEVEKLILEADQASGGNPVFQAHAARAVGGHVDNLPPAQPQRLHDGA